MTIQNPKQNNDYKPQISSQARLSEIGKILASGICRLHYKNLQKISDKGLDCAKLPSVHGFCQT